MRGFSAIYSYGQHPDTSVTLCGSDHGQPIYNNERSIALVGCGTCYPDPVAHNTSLRQESAATLEAIIPLYERYGADCLNYLRGTFAFCLYDMRKALLFIARDRMGEQPLYYAEIPSGVVASSDLQTILENHIAEPQLNIHALLAPIRFTGGISPRDTFVEQIKRVLPGEYLLVSAKGVKRQQYWQRKRSYDYPGTIESARQETLQIMQEAVSLQMQCDEPVAVMLSGGVDSSAIAALAKRGGYAVHTITTGYTGSHEQDEREVARRFAAEQGFAHYEIILSEQDYLDSFEEMTACLDEPMTDSTAIAQWALFKKVKELGFKVLLTGMGGDELFYGYPAWNSLGDSLRLRREHEALFPWTGLEKKKQWLRFMLHHLKWVLMAGYPSKLEDRSYGWWIRDDYYRFVSDARLVVGDEQYPLSRYNIYKDFAPCPAGKEIDLIYDDAIDTVMTQAYLYLSNRLSVAQDLEVRAPLLDYKLVEHVMSLPLEYKYLPGKPKQYMKDLLAGLVPNYILNAPKRGFSSPPSFINHVAEPYCYKCFDATYQFYNSVLADRVLSRLWKK